MAEPLTNSQEPGFVSQIQESPSLALTPGSVQVVGLIGEGKATKTVTEALTRSAATFDALSYDTKVVSLMSSNAIFRYPASSYAIAVASGDLAAIGAGLDGLVLNIKLEGGVTNTVTWGTPATIAIIASEADSGMADFSTEGITVGGAEYLVIYPTALADQGKAIYIEPSTAATALSLTADSWAKWVRWDPVVTDSNFAPQATEEYQVEYERPKVAADFAPKTFFSLRQVAAEYGDPAASGHLTLQAQGAFGNGASIVVCRQLDHSKVGVLADKKTETAAALVDLERLDVSIVVPGAPINEDGVNGASSVDGEYLEHVSKMSSKLERKERTCILGVDETSAQLSIPGSTGGWQDLMSTFAPAVGVEAKRVMVISPGQSLTTYKGVQIACDSSYVAACLAGRMVNSDFDEAEPMTRKTLATIDELVPVERTRAEQNILTSLGVIVVEAKGGSIRVRRAVTADGTSIPKQEPSIVRAFDRIAMDLREALETRFVGTKILNTTHTAIEAATGVFLDRFVAGELIGTFRNVKAEQNPLEPRQFDISFEAIPVFPFLWGFIDLSINIS